MNPQLLMKNPSNGPVNFDQYESLQIMEQIHKIKQSQSADFLNLHRAKFTLAHRYAKVLIPYLKPNQTTRARLTFIRAFTKTIPYGYLARNEDFFARLTPKSSVSAGRKTTLSSKSHHPLLNLLMKPKDEMFHSRIVCSIIPYSIFPRSTHILSRITFIVNRSTYRINPSYKRDFRCVDTSFSNLKGMLRSKPSGVTFYRMNLSL